MDNTIFSLNNGSHIGFGTLIDIDSYMLEAGEDLKIKYNIYIEDENRDIHSFYHKGGKPSESIYNSLNKKMFFIVNKNNEIEYISDLITNKKINYLIKEWYLKNEPDFDTIKIIMLMLIFIAFFMGDLLFLKNGISNKQLIINTSLFIIPVISYAYIKIIEFKKRKEIRKESDYLKKELKEWIDNKESQSLKNEIKKNDLIEV